MNKPNSNSLVNIEGWKDINWKKVEKYVFKLQKQIFKASKSGNLKKVRQLQKTLMRSWSNRVLAVRKVTQDNTGKKTAGVDGVKSLSPEARLELVRRLKLSGKAKPTRRVWIPKPGRTEKRPLGIPIMYDRALQSCVKAILEPEWEAKFEKSSYGFRPGRSSHDAIKHIKAILIAKPKYVLDADIAQCFDRIDHQYLLNKIGYKGKLRQQIKAWLKSGVLDAGTFQATDQGTPQGGVCSPLLANIALHGLEEMLDNFAETLPGKKRENKWALNFIRYADDFIVMHKSKEIVLQCQNLIQRWLKQVGLELKPEKTRIAHTLSAKESEDGQAGFDFLGFHIQQYPVSKYKANRDSQGRPTGFDLLITPSQKSIKKQGEKIKSIINKHKQSPQEGLIKELNPIIRGWCNYYQISDAKIVGYYHKLDNQMYLQLRTWALKRCKSSKKGHNKYWHKIGNSKWNFSTPEGVRLLKHEEHQTSSTSYVKVKEDRSPYDGDWVYWATRMGKHPEVNTRVARLLKQQKGKCSHCELNFKHGDKMEVDHITPKYKGGKDTWINLQLLHKHCHDQKTAIDASNDKEEHI
jgi:RNA-directed DNA polymerase